MSTNFDAVICGYYGYENAGDDAVLGVIIEEIEDNIPGASVAVIASKKEKYRFDNVHFINRYNPAKVLGALHGAGVFVFGGGTLLQNSTSRRSLIYYGAVIFLAKLFCKKTVIFANGIGKIKKNGDLILSRVLRFADRISLRDPVSYETALKMGANRENTFLRADPVFLLKHNDRKSVGLPENYFAVSLRNTESKQIEKEIAKFCNIKRNEGTQAVFIPMQEKFDGEICRRVAAECGGMVLDRLSPENIAKVLEGAEFAVGMRLHFLLLARMQEIPTVSLSYDIKISVTVPYAGNTPVIPLESVTAKELEMALIKAKNTDRQEAVCRCEKMQKLAYEDISMLCDEIREAVPGHFEYPVRVKPL